MAKLRSGRTLPKTKKSEKDFQKIKRKIGRKLPPAQNATNTEIKSKAIILRQQSVAVDKTGLAVNRKGLTLKELLQQTSHHNAKVRRDALSGIRDLCLTHPMELRLHKLAVIEKLRERIGDVEPSVRSNLFGLFKTVILPGCKEENFGALISLLMVYVFNAMTNLSVDVRLFAFNFLELLVKFYPPTFQENAEKILQNHEDILQKNSFHVEDKEQLKIVLSSLSHCLSQLPYVGKEDSLGEHITESRVLHAVEPYVPKDSAGYICIIRRLEGIVPFLVNWFKKFASAVNAWTILDNQSFDCLLSILQSIDLAVSYFVRGHENYYVDLALPHERTRLTRSDNGFHLSLEKLFNSFPFKPAPHLSEEDDSRYFILNLFISKIFFSLHRSVQAFPDSLERFLEFTESVLSNKISGGKQFGHAALKEKNILSLVSFLPDLLVTIKLSWRLRLLQAFTEMFKACSPASSMKISCVSAIEKMLLSENHLLYLHASDKKLHVIQSSWIQELPSLLVILGDARPGCSKIVLRLLLRLGQVSGSNTFIEEEYNRIQSSLLAFYGDVSYGPFMRLPDDCQELSICCIYYFSPLYPPLLTSLASCCLCHDLKSSSLFRIVEVVNTAFRAGHIWIEGYIGFMVTILTQFDVIPEKVSLVENVRGMISNRETFKLVTGSICSLLCRIGDSFSVFRILEEVIIDLLSSKLPLDNARAMLRLLVMMNFKSTQLSEHSIMKLSSILLGYLIDITICFSEGCGSCSVSTNEFGYCYFLLPCCEIFGRSINVLKAMLAMMNSSVFACDLPHSHYCNEISGDTSKWMRVLVSIVSMILKEANLRDSVPAIKAEIECISKSILSLQSKEEVRMSLEQRHKAKMAVDRLKTMQLTIMCSGVS